jgi:hypothetical protein
MLYQMARNAIAGLLVVTGAVPALTQGLTQPSLGSSAVKPPPPPNLGVNTNLRATPNLTPAARPNPLPPAPPPSPPPATLPSATIPYTRGQAVVGPQPPAGNPGNKVTVTPSMIDTPPTSARGTPGKAPGVIVTVPTK